MIRVSETPVSESSFTPEPERAETRGHRIVACVLRRLRTMLLFARCGRARSAAATFLFACVAFESSAFAGEVETPQEDDAKMRSAPSPAVEPSPSIADRDEAAPHERRAVGEPATWYGWQILLADAGSVALALGVSSASRSAAPLGYFGGLYLTAAPILHLAHKRGWAALASFGARTSLALGCSLIVMFASIGSSLASITLVPTPHDAKPKDTFDVLGGAGALATIGMSATVLSMLDAAFASEHWSMRQNEAHASPSRQTPFPRLSPSVDIGRGSARFALSGTF